MSLRKRFWRLHLHVAGGTAIHKWALCASLRRGRFGGFDAFAAVGPYRFGLDWR
jgi:hypothetical protein